MLTTIHEAPPTPPPDQPSPTPTTTTTTVPAPGDKELPVTGASDYALVIGLSMFAVGAAIVWMLRRSRRTE